MPKVHKRIAKFNRYKFGFKKKDEKTISGFRLDKSKPRDENDYIFCPKGEVYYWYKKMRQPRTESRIYPKPSELTSSEYFGDLYAIIESIEDFNPESIYEIEDFRDEIVSQINELKERTDEKLNNMPYQLQEAPTGELLRERVESLETYTEELEGLEFEPLDKESWEEEWDNNNNTEEEESEANRAIDWSDHKALMLQEAKDILSEVEVNS